MLKNYKLLKFRIMKKIKRYKSLGDLTTCEIIINTKNISTIEYYPILTDNLSTIPSYYVVMVGGEDFYIPFSELNILIK